ncbi:MAG: hypothetical protein O2909_07460 [Chloroflexi bacterium]|nr:hypothetical protein [Chloroflexota bacterium]MDA1219263.1 hypothetical protein [Chloroflexota bacterium]
MERGSYCYFCGTQLVKVENDPFGTCYECFKCPPVTHWRWNEDTEFLQLYVAGERCPYCHLQVPDADSDARTPAERQAPVAPAPVATPVPSKAPASAAPTPAATPAPSDAPASVGEPEPTAQQAKKPGKPVTVDDVLWGSVVEWCRANNDHDTRNHHNCSKELARMQAKGDLVVVWHNRDRIPGTGELIQA